MKRFALLCSLFGLLFVPMTAICANKKPILFNEFYFGQPKKEIAAITGAKQTEGNEFDALSLEDVLFAREKWIQIFFFEEEKLDRIVLTGNYDVPYMAEKVSSALNMEKFYAVKAQCDDYIMDIIEEIGRSGIEEVLDKLEEFLVEHTKNIQYMSFLYLNNEHVLQNVHSPKWFVAMFPSYEAIIKKSPNALRQVIVELDMTRDPAPMHLQFTLPSLTKKTKTDRIRGIK